MKKIDLSVIIPCLNEEDTIENCIKKVFKCLKKYKIKGEVLVIDNGSQDKSVQIAKKNNARVVFEIEQRGYGAALKKGIVSSKGQYIIMADADDSYDFSVLHKFYFKLKEGYDLVQGCRFPSGGGKIMINAMPNTHKYIGNPFFTLLLKIMFGSIFNDVYCGMRGFKKSIALEHNYVCNGMQFAIENLIKFIIADSKVCEIPITLFKDGRIKSKNHLKTVSDGLKTLKIILIFSPNWIFIVTSIISIFLFLITYYKNIINFQILNLDQKTVLVNNLIFLITVNFQLFFIWLNSRMISINLGFQKQSKFLNFFFKIFSLKIAGILFFICFMLNNFYIDFLYSNKLLMNMALVIFASNCLLVSVHEIQKNKKF
jgi:glycosyltransferase involved in cell wall biosynthesis